MTSALLEEEQQERRAPSLPALSFSLLLHAIVALASWICLMLVGYALNPQNAPQPLILALSFVFPLLVGLAVNHFRQAQMATVVWLLGVLWIMSAALWIIDMPTGPYHCLHCSTTEKISRTFFSFPSPSGLVDDDGPFLGTWPAAALIGYAIGAGLALRRRRAEA